MGNRLNRRSAALRSRVADLPERIFPRELVVLSEGPQVAPADFDSLAVDRGAADRPLRDAAVTAGEVVVVVIADVRDALEASRQAPADLVLAHEAPPPQIGSARRFEDAVVSE